MSSPQGPGARTMKGAEVLVESLVRAGVRTLFGVPGDTGVAFYDALFHRTADITHVLARDERHAGAMADAFARTAGGLGVVEVSSGGGTTYVVGGLGEAMASGVPVLLLTSDIHAASHGSGALTEIDQPALFRAVTKSQRVVASAAEIPAALAEQISTALNGHPGPTVLIVPENVYEERVGVDEALLAPLDSCRHRDRPQAPPDEVARTAELIAAARRPVIVSGSGVHAAAAWDQLARLAERAAVPVATTIHGIGSLPADNPWLLGTCGNNGGLPPVNRVLAGADLVLFVGTRANATDTNSWTAPPRAGVPVAHVDIDPDRAGHNFPGAVRLVGDAAVVLDQLLAATPEATEGVRGERTAGVRRVKDEWEAWDRANRPVELPAGEIDPAVVVETLREVLGGHAVTILADPGTPTPAVAAYWPPARAARDVVVPRGHGPMGYAIPAAVGVAFARPDHVVVSLTADGSFAMACGELETVTRLHLPVLFVQLTNNSLGWIKMLQHLYEGDRYFGVDPGPIDASAVAAACGLRSRHVHSVTELRDAVAQFADDHRPTYLDVDVPHLIDRVPVVPAWLDALAGTRERPVY